MPISCHFRGCKAPLSRIVSSAISSELSLPLPWPSALQQDGRRTYSAADTFRDSTALANWSGSAARTLHVRTAINLYAIRCCTGWCGNGLAWRLPRALIISSCIVSEPAAVCIRSVRPNARRMRCSSLSLTGSILHTVRILSVDVWCDGWPAHDNISCTTEQATRRKRGLTFICLARVCKYN